MSNPDHEVFETDGTRYDLVLVDDPYGGILVVWPQGKQFWRYHPGDRLKPLMAMCNDYDTRNIFAYLETRRYRC